MPDKKRFRPEDINNKEYMLEVKRTILNNLDKGRLYKVHVLSFHTKFSKELKFGYSRTDPYFDAWMCVLGKQRPEFDVREFRNHHPSVMKKIIEENEKSR